MDANFTDDVGQTLLNWSSAFGTIDMVTYLCDKGADVNKGQRSSSLHYAACFGRPDVCSFACVSFFWLVGRGFFVVCLTDDPLLPVKAHTIDIC